MKFQIISIDIYDNVYTYIILPQLYSNYLFQFSLFLSFSLFFNLTLSRAIQFFFRVNIVEPECRRNILSSFLPSSSCVCVAKA